MKNIKHFALASALILSATGLFAQNNNYQQPYGYIARFADFGISRLYELSQYRTNLGTARSAAMGGAFTSLGADLSSMNINPAGLGFYQSSEFGITLSPSFTNMTNSMHGEHSAVNSRTSFGLNNIGVVFNAYQGSGYLTSFTFGIGYSNLADHNYTNSVFISNGTKSIIDMYYPQVLQYYDRQNGNLHALDGDYSWRLPSSGGAYLEEWGAILAYQTNLFRFGNDGFYSPGLAENAGISKGTTTRSKGSTNEFTFSGGWNFNNTFYFGLTLGIIDIYQNKEVIYSENYFKNNDAEDPAEHMDYSQRTKTSGEGYNLKLGMIFRPYPELRIGFAFHSPTIVSVKNSYNSHMNVKFKEDRAIYIKSTPEIEFVEKFYTPSRFLAGISHTIGNMAIISVDYENTWYNGIRLRSDEYDLSFKEDYREEIRNHFQSSNTVKLGAEVRATNMLSLRAGYIYSNEGLKSNVKDGTDVLNIPLQTSSNTITAGIGFKITPSASIDLAYVFSAAKYTDYDLFWFDDTISSNKIIYPGGANSQGKPYQTSLKQQRHNIMLSMSCKF